MVKFAGPMHQGFLSVTHINGNQGLVAQGSSRNSYNEAPIKQCSVYFLTLCKLHLMYNGINGASCNNPY